jgi:hydrogenase large subunit
MVPGGVVCIPSAHEISNCLFLLSNFRQWYERRVLGCTIERWLEVRKKSDINVWLDETDSHANSDLGFFIRFGREAGLDKLGKGHGNFISFGSMDMPENTAIKSHNNDGSFLPSGFTYNSRVRTFNQEKITEDLSHSWFSEGGRYSWAKAPRYDGMPAETGPLAEMVMATDPLILDMVREDGPNVYLRELARLVRTAFLIPVMEQWLKETASCKEEFYCDHGKAENGDGYGLVEAPRGALGHWVKIGEEKIESYQIITPTAWNASPRDANGVRGPWEEALIGTEIKDLDNPVEIDHIIRSFDPCLVCTVHTINLKKRPRTIFV